MSYSLGWPIPGNFITPTAVEVRKAIYDQLGVSSQSNLQILICEISLYKTEIKYLFDLLVETEYEESVKCDDIYSNPGQKIWSVQY